MADELCGQEQTVGEPLDNADLLGAHLAGQVLVETIDPTSPLKTRNEKLKQQIQACLVACLTTEQMPPTEQAIAGLSLAFLGETRPDVACDVPEIVDVPAGAFLMGSKEGETRAAFVKGTPQHEVITPAFRIGKYPVTNAQFAYFVHCI